MDKARGAAWEQAARGIMANEGERSFFDAGFDAGVQWAREQGGGTELLGQRLHRTYYAYWGEHLPVGDGSWSSLSDSAMEGWEHIAQAVCGNDQ